MSASPQTSTHPMRSARAPTGFIGKAVDQNATDKSRTGQELKIISIHLGAEVNASNCLARIRVVPDRRVGNLVYGRSIRPDEPDNGQGIPIFDEMSLSFPVGSIRFTITDVECHSEPKAGGYAPVANVVWTWLALPPKTDQKVFIEYLLAASRRLDEGHAHCQRALSHLNRLQEMGSTSTNRKWIPPAVAFRTRESAAEAWGAAESMCVSLARVVRMIADAQQTIGTTIAVPDEVARIASAAFAIRHAVEHIDERAAGRAHRESPDIAVSIFDQTDLFAAGVLRYAGHALDIHQDVLPAFLAGRRFILEAATMHGATKVLPSPIYIPAPIEWQSYAD